MADTLLIDTLDVGALAHVVTFADLLAAGPIAGDLITRDFAPGAVWQTQGHGEAYTMVVPLVMRAATRAQALADVATIAAYRGRVVTLTRRVADPAGTPVDATCQAVITADVTPIVDPPNSSHVTTTITCQNLTGGWL